MMLFYYNTCSGQSILEIKTVDMNTLITTIIKFNLLYTFKMNFINNEIKL